MPRTFECPKCGEDIGDSYQGAEPDVGVSAGYYCDACNEGFADDGEYEGHETDVSISSLRPHSSVSCIKCSVPYEFGYGLAGGGMGPYMYCPQCGAVVNKMQDFT